MAIKNRISSIYGMETTNMKLLLTLAVWTVVILTVVNIIYVLFDEEN